ncbi:MAG TPA: GH116 family glycosyl-hydrolase, partial [Chthonomonadales bacterium]|nr:GH116 family glycosyl-hydrolase [Chthonomonadales bacterium]
MLRAAALLAAAACVPAQPVQAGGRTHLLRQRTTQVQGQRILATSPTGRLDQQAPVALGGIGCGYIAIRPDGMVTSAAIAGDGRPTGELPACFAAIWTRAAGTSEARILANRARFQLPPVQSLKSDALYPELTLIPVGRSMPVDAMLRIFSPFVPGDLQSSSQPCLCYLFTLKNTTAFPVDVSVAVSFQNAMDTGAPGPNGAPQRWILRASGVRRGFGASFGAIGSRSGMTLLAGPPRRDATVSWTGWIPNGQRPAWWTSFENTGDLPGEPGPQNAGAVVVAMRLALKPKETLQAPFALSWFSTGGGGSRNAGHYYEESYKDSDSVAQSLIANWRSLYALTDEWRHALLSSSLPTVLADRLVSSVQTFSTQTALTADGRFGFLSGNASETAVRLVSPSERLRVCTLALSLFPDLAGQELDRYTRLEISTGEFRSPHPAWI